MRPVTFNWIPSQGGGPTRYGFTAQDVIAASGNDKAPGVYYDSNSDRYGLNYAELISPTVRAVQEIDKTAQDLDRTVVEQQKTIDGQEKRIAELEGKLRAQEKKNAEQDARLKAIEQRLAKQG